MLILVFIFLTPKSWFANATYQQNQTAQSTVAVGVDVVGNQLDTSEIQRRARHQANRPQGQVTKVREIHDSFGKVIAYEVDIR